MEFEAPCPDDDGGELVLLTGTESEHGYEDRDARYRCTWCEVVFVRDPAGGWAPV